MDTQGRLNLLFYIAIRGPLFPSDTVERGTYIARFDTSGNQINRLRIYDGVNVFLFNDFQIDQLGDFYLSGELATDSAIIGGQLLYKETPDFGFDLFLIKLNSSGISEWVIKKGYPIQTNISGMAMTFDQSMNLIWIGLTANDIVLGTDTFYNYLNPNNNF